MLHFRYIKKMISKNTKHILMIEDNHNIDIVFGIRYRFKILLILTIKLEDINSHVIKKKISLYLIIIY